MDDYSLQTLSHEARSPIYTMSDSGDIFLLNPALTFPPTYLGLAGRSLQKIVPVARGDLGDLEMTDR